MRGRGNRPSLQQELDKAVFQIVRKFQDEQTQQGALPTSTDISTYIQSSNSPLKRKPRNILDASIERVLDVLCDEAEELGQVDVEFEEEAPTKPAATRSNIMNKALRGNLAPPSNGTTTPVSEKEKKPESRQINGEPSRKKRRVEKVEQDRSPPMGVSLSDLGGLGKVKRQLKEHLVLPLLCPQEYATRQIALPRGILLHGPPGCGKTMLSRAFAAAIGVPFVEILGPSVVSGMSGESEQKIREHFEEARRLAPCLVFIDEIDVIAPKRDNAQSQMEKRIVAQILISMDSLALENNDGKPVIVLAATNRPDSIDPALRRGGRFETEINMGVPNETMREKILRAQTRKTRIASDVDFARLAKMTPGYVGADLCDLVGKAGTWSMDQFRKALEAQAEEMEGNMQIDGGNEDMDDEDLSITRLIRRVKDQTAERPPGFEGTAISMEAFLAVLPEITPSSKREGFATIPDTTWSSVGALHEIRKKLERAIVQPIKDPERFKAVGISAPTGVLLWGPPGCGKTLVAKAVANESKANFISVKGPELLNKFVGESERAVRQVFTRARSSVPCVLFFDEIDAIIPSRHGGDGSGSEASARVVNTLLTELDGLSMREGIYFIGATNRPDIIDPAMLRPGRLETLLYVGLPEPQDRPDILRALIAGSGGRIDPELAEIASESECNNFSGADLGALLRQAGNEAIERNSDRVEHVDFVVALRTVKPSVPDIRKYEDMKKKIRTGQSGL